MTRAPIIAIIDVSCQWIKRTLCRLSFASALAAVLLILSVFAKGALKISASTSRLPILITEISIEGVSNPSKTLAQNALVAFLQVLLVLAKKSVDKVVCSRSMPNNPFVSL